MLESYYHSPHIIEELIIIFFPEVYTSWGKSIIVTANDFFSISYTRRFMMGGDTGCGDTPPPITRGKNLFTPIFSSVSWFKNAQQRAFHWITP